MTEHNEVQVDIEWAGPEPEVVDEVSQAISEHPSVQEQLSETRQRLLSIELLNPEGAGRVDGLEPDRYRTTTYDYTNNRVILATDLSTMSKDRWRFLSQATSHFQPEKSSKRPSKSCVRILILGQRSVSKGSSLNPLCRP